MVDQPRNLKTEQYSDFESRNGQAARWSEDEVLRSLVTSRNPWIVDVGAYTGTSAIRFRAIWPECELDCFEPNPTAREELNVTRIRLGGLLRVHSYALCNEEGTADFVVQGINPGLSGLSPRNLESRDSIDVSTRSSDPAFQAAVNRQKITVETRRLDQILENDGRDIDLLKIDVQSHESDVLAGARETLTRTQALLVEISLYDFYEHESSFLAVEEHTSRAGLRLWAITAHSRNPRSGRTDWVNAVYWRPSSYVRTKQVN